MSESIGRREILKLAAAGIAGGQLVGTEANLAQDSSDSTSDALSRISRDRWARNARSNLAGR